MQGLAWGFLCGQPLRKTNNRNNRRVSRAVFRLLFESSYLENQANHMAMNNSTASPTQNAVSHDNTAETNVNQVFYVVAFAIGCTGNLLVLIVVIGRKERRTVNDLFIFNLALSDLSYLFLCLPTNFVMSFETAINHEIYCRFVWAMQTWTICVCIYTLASMAIHRCRVILNPFNPEMTHRKIYLWIGVVWLISLIYVTPLMIVTKPKVVKPQGCKEDWPSQNFRRSYTATLFVLQFILPLTVIAIAYIRIGLDLTRPMAGNGDVGGRSANLCSERRRENMLVIKTLATIVILFAVCLLPAQIAWMMLDFGTDKDKKIAADVFFKFAPMLLYIHSCVNPIVYGTLTRHFRRGYIKYLSYVFCCHTVWCKTRFSKDKSHSKITNGDVSTQTQYFLRGYFSRRNHSNNDPNSKYTCCFRHAHRNADDNCSQYDIIVENNNLDDVEEICRESESIMQNRKETTV